MPQVKTVIPISQSGNVKRVKVGGVKGNAVNAIKTKHKTKRVSTMNTKDLGDIVEALAIRAGLADENGIVLP